MLRVTPIGEMGIYEICDVCGWEGDPVQSADPTYADGTNSDSLNTARWRKAGVVCNPAPIKPVQTTVWRMMAPDG